MEPRPDEPIFTVSDLNREARELLEKLSAPSIPDLELDVANMVDADTMAEKMYQAVPSSFE